MLDHFNKNWTESLKLDMQNGEIFNNFYEVINTVLNKEKYKMKNLRVKKYTLKLKTEP